MTQERPRIAPATAPATKRVRRGSVLVSVALAGAACIRYFSLPEVVPVHFGASGEPDAHGPRASVLWLALLFVTLTIGCAWLSKHPRRFNYPVPVTEEDAAALYGEGERMLVWLLVPVQLIFFAVLQAVLLTGAVSWLIWVGLAGLFAVTLAGIVRMTRVT